MNAERLLTFYDRAADAPDAVSRLRQTILDLAVRGKLVEQNPRDEPSSKLLERIKAKKDRLVKTDVIRKKKASSESQVNKLPFSLPSSWAWVSIETAFLYDAGIKREPKILDPYFWLLELQDVEKDTGHLITKVMVKDRTSKSTKSEFRPGDILYGKLRPYLNKVLVADEPGYSTTEIVAIRPYVPLCSEYCALALRRSDFLEYVTRLGQGTKMPRLRTQDAMGANFPLPPLAEQHRIVKKVDELMELCDEIEASRTKKESIRENLTISCLRRLTDSKSSEEEFRNHVRFVINNISPLTVNAKQIRQFRKLILELAVRGKLVEQDSDDEPASELLNRIHHERGTSMSKNISCPTTKRDTPIEEYSPFEIPDSWSWISIGETGRIFSGNSTNQTMKENLSRNKSGYPYIMTKDIGYGFDPLNYENNMKVPYELNNFKIAKRFSVLICAEGGSAGRKIGITDRPICFGNKLIANEMWSPIIPRYVLIVYLSNYFYHEFSIRMKGVISGISLRKFLEIPFPLPPLAEQHRIVKKVDELMEICNRLEKNIGKRSDRMVRLLDSALTKTLCG